MDELKFNQLIHESTENGDLIRNDDGSIRKKRDWKALAVDRQGRKFNEKIHIKDYDLDVDGFLKVRRRDPDAKRSGQNRTEAFVAKYREAGYAYYIANDDGGRLEQMVANDWEPVMTEDGPAKMKVGQARAPNTVGRLFRKPEEWYQADQRAKVAQNIEDFKEHSSPKEEDGQYEAKAPSPLR